ncbi:unnamed protein product, partial [Tilletia controversa]
KAFWWHEAERGAADVPGLNLVIMRSAAIWGPFQYVAPLMPRIFMGQLYAGFKEPMKLLRKILDVVGQAFKVETGFVNTAITTWAKLNLSSVVDDVNAKHMEMVFKLVKHVEDPAYVDGASPLTCFLDAETLANRALALDGSKMTRITGWKPTHHLSAEALLAIRSEFNTQAPEAWPTLPGQ